MDERTTRPATGGSAPAPSKPSGETIAAKAARLVAAGAVTITADSDRLITATVHGDHRTYGVTVTPTAASEAAPAPGRRFAHVAAVQLATAHQLPHEEETMTSDLEPTPTFEVEHLRRPGPKPEDDYPPQPAEEETDLEEAYPTVDLETGGMVCRPRVQPPGTDRPLPIAEAPVTFQTLRAISMTQFVPAALRGRPEAILAAVIYGREIGLPPMQSLAHVDIIDGRPSPSAELTARLARAAGHRIEILEATDTVCHLRGTRADTAEELEVTFTIDDTARVTTKEHGTTIRLHRDQTLEGIPRRHALRQSHHSASPPPLPRHPIPNPAHARAQRRGAEPAMIETRDIWRCPQCHGLWYDPAEGSCRWCHWRPTSPTDEAALTRANPNLEENPDDQSRPRPTRRRNYKARHW